MRRFTATCSSAIRSWRRGSRTTTRNRSCSIQCQKELTIGGFEIGWNDDFSELDQSFIEKMYPAGAISG